MRTRTKAYKPKKARVKDMPCIMVTRHPLNKKVLNVVNNPNTPEYLSKKSDGSDRKWEVLVEFYTQEEYDNLPKCTHCDLWVDLCKCPTCTVCGKKGCGGIHIDKEAVKLNGKGE